MLRVWSSQKLDPTPNTKSHKFFFALNQSRSDFNEHKQFSNSLLRLRSWDFDSMLGLGNVNETWDLGPHVNRP